MMIQETPMEKMRERIEMMKTGDLIKKDQDKAKVRELEEPVERLEEVEEMVVTQINLVTMTLMRKIEVEVKEEDQDLEDTLVYQDQLDQQDH